ARRRWTFDLWLLAVRLLGMFAAVSGAGSDARPMDARFIPPLVWAARRWQPSWIRITGWTLLALGLFAVVGQCVHELLTWYAEVPDDLRLYIWQRTAYALACNTDLPAVQMVIGGVVLLVVGRWRQ